MEITIRKAVGEDVVELANLLKQWLNETDMNYPGYCEYSMAWLAGFIYNNMVFVAVKGEEIIGTLGLKYSQFPWNNEFNAWFCDFLIINKDNRKNGVAKKLLECSKSLSDTTKLPVFLGIMTGNFATRKDRFLEMSGFKYAGGNFVYGV